MAQPKKQTSKSRTGTRRSHLIAKLQRAVNRRSPVKVGHKKTNTASAKRTTSKSMNKKSASGKTAFKAKQPMKALPPKKQTKAKPSKGTSSSKKK